MKTPLFKYAPVLGFLITTMPLLAGQPSEELTKFRSVEIQIRTNKQSQAKVQGEIIKTSVQMRKLRQAKATTHDKAVCGDCGDIAREFCSNTENESATVTTEPKATSCWRIYQNKECYTSLPITAKAKVNVCYRVQNDLELTSLDTKLDKLRDRKQWLVNEMAGLVNDHVELKEKVAFSGELDSVGTTTCVNCPQTPVVVNPETTTSRSPASEATSE